MTAMGLLSAKGSPGATTSAVLLAALWPAPSVLLEADPAGGDLRCWYRDEHGRPLHPDRGVVSLLTTRGAAGDGDAGASTAAQLALHTQVLPGGLPVLIGPDGPGQVAATDGLWDRLAAAVTAHDGHVVIDGGRWTAPSALTSTPTPQLTLLRACQLTLLVCRATVASLAHARELLSLLTGLGLPVQVLVIGSSSPFSSSAVSSAGPAMSVLRTDVAAALGCTPEHVQVLPHDPVSAAAVTGQWSRRLDRSRLVRAAREVAGELYPQVQLPADSALGEPLEAQGAWS